MKKTRLFWIEKDGSTIKDAYKYEVDQFGDKDDLEWAAERFAEYYYDNYDGWESSWPITFSVANENGDLLGKIVVRIEPEPHFYGTKEQK
jgi:hypothetical protein